MYVNILPNVPEIYEGVQKKGGPFAFEKIIKIQTLYEKLLLLIWWIYKGFECTA